MALPTDAKVRKNAPLARGLLDYFPDALFAVADLSRVGNEQHNPGEPLHWAKEKSTDEADCIIRHLVDRGTLDTDGVRHSTKVAWRALANLQREIDAEQKLPVVRAGNDERWVPEVARKEPPPLPGKYEHACPDLDQEFPPCVCGPDTKCTGAQFVADLRTGERRQCVVQRAKDDKRFDVA